MFGLAVKTTVWVISDPAWMAKNLRRGVCVCVCNKETETVNNSEVIWLITAEISYGN